MVAEGGEEEGMMTAGKQASESRLAATRATRDSTRYFCCWLFSTGRQVLLSH